jgi:exopolyphosphatase / guanosine-5'-triphosphate,3'-diphosphate pyrophosphatase
VSRSHEITTIRWVKSLLNRVGHERRVMQLATLLFDETHDLHGLEANHRELLRLAAIVHDVGRCVSAANHPKIGARMLRRDTTLPISPDARRQLCYLTRHHRGAVPEIGFDDILHIKDNPVAMRVILALLRAADTLDNRNLASPNVTVRRRGYRLVISCDQPERLDKARQIFTRRRKFRLLEDVLGCRVKVRVRPAAVARLAA